jgi:hypothetical protein
VVADWFDLAPVVRGLGGVLVATGILVFGTNMLLVIRDHSPHSIGYVVLGALYPR